MSSIDLVVPDIGNFDAVPIVDVLVKVGDSVEVETPLITLETDKATMDVPASSAGIITELLVKRGDKVGKGTVIARVTATGSAAAPAPTTAPAAQPAAAPAAAAPPATAARPRRRPPMARVTRCACRFPMFRCSAGSRRSRIAAPRSWCWVRAPVATRRPSGPRIWD